MRGVRTIILAAVSRRDLCYVSENESFCFAKNKLIHADPTFIARRSRAHFCFMKFIPINVLIPYLSIWVGHIVPGRYVPLPKFNKVNLGQGPSWPRSIVPRPNLAKAQLGHMSHYFIDPPSFGSLSLHCPITPQYFFTFTTLCLD